MSKTAQLRIYSIRPDRLDEWIDKFHRLVVPLRQELGFKVESSWVDREHSQHIWIISYSGDTSFDEANVAYWASQKRDKLGVDPSQFLIGEETHTIEPVP